MPGTAVPALVGVILLPLVGLLAVLAERRSAAARWFGLLNLLLAGTCALGAASTSAPEGQAARALLCGKLANATASVAFLALYLQLAALSRDTRHPVVERLRRLRWAAVALTLVIGFLCAGTPWVVVDVAWVPGIGYLPRFGKAVPGILFAVLVVGGWAAALLYGLIRHGDRRVRRKAAWIAVGVVGFDLFGMVLLAMVLPHAGVHTEPWAPTSLTAGSMVMLGALVLTRQRELDDMQSHRSWGRRIRENRLGKPSEEPSCHSCTTCGGMVTPQSGLAYCPLDGGAIIGGTDPWLGRTIEERFLVEEVLGAGGMGRVYRVQHLRLGVALALKLLNADLAADRRTAERFAREARATMRIHSPHVVTVHDLGELPPGIPFLTMELIQGSTLSSLLSTGSKLTAPSVALLGVQLAKGLAIAHAEGVIHRDLKPDNVLIASNGERHVAKIVDFGLAKIIDESLGPGELTTIGRVFGTPAYISPEQASGRGADAKSDVYALGAILYRARAGRKPFEGTALELLAQHIGEAPPPLSDDPFDRLILTLLAKNPDDRPDARTLAAALATFTDGSGQLRVAAKTGHAVATDPTLPAAEGDDER